PDRHGHDGKSERRIRAHSAHEHVVTPHDKAEQANREHGIDHRLVSEDRLARKRRQHLRRHAHAGENRDVNLGMSKEPEQMLPQQWRSATVLHEVSADAQSTGHEEACAQVAVHEQQDARGQQHTKSQQSQDSRNEPSPTGQGHSHHGHALGAKIEDSGNEIQRPISEAAQKIAILVIHRSAPSPSPGPAPGNALKGAYPVQPWSGAPPSTKNAAIMTTKATNVVQKDNIFSVGNAMSGAPIWIGRK